MKGRKVSGLALGLALAALFSAPAQAVPDEGGGAAQFTPAPQVRVEGFDWSDAGVGIGIGAAGAAVAVATALAMRRAGARRSEARHRPPARGRRRPPAAATTSGERTKRDSGASVQPSGGR
jgi:hypothetical protein